MPELLKPLDTSGSHGAAEGLPSTLLESARFSIQELRGINHELMSRLNDLRCTAQDAGISFDNLAIMLSMNKADYVLNKHSLVEAAIQGSSADKGSHSQEAHPIQQTGRHFGPDNGNTMGNLEGDVDEGSVGTKVSLIKSSVKLKGEVERHMEIWLNGNVQAAEGGRTSESKELTEEDKAKTPHQSNKFPK